MAFIDPKVGGTVFLTQGLEKNLVPNGVLFIIAKKIQTSPNSHEEKMPIAVLKVTNPRFPQAFVITEKHIIKPGASLRGPMHVIARYSPVGDALDQKGAIEGDDPRLPSTDVGNKDLNIELKNLIK